jgi:hypothetical protein
MTAGVGYGLKNRLVITWMITHTDPPLLVFMVGCKTNKEVRYGPRLVVEEVRASQCLQELFDVNNMYSPCKIYISSINTQVS